MHGDHSHSHGPDGGAGHNSVRPAKQWQTPHLHGPEHRYSGQGERDFDLVEKAFADTFPQAPDPTSFLRLAGIPFVGRRADGACLRLLRVEYGQMTDVGSITPHLGGEGVRYAPLPAKLAGRRTTLAFVYHADGETLHLTLAEARQLADETPPA